MYATPIASVPVQTTMRVRRVVQEHYCGARASAREVQQFLQRCTSNKKMRPTIVQMLLPGTARDAQALNRCIDAFVQCMHAELPEHANRYSTLMVEATFVRQSFEYAMLLQSTEGVMAACEHLHGVYDTLHESCCTVGKDCKQLAAMLHADTLADLQREGDSSDEDSEMDEQRLPDDTQVYGPNCYDTTPLPDGDYRQRDDDDGGSSEDGSDFSMSSEESAENSAEGSYTSDESFIVEEAPDAAPAV